MLPSVRSRLPSGRWAAEMVAASSRQYEAPPIPHSMITNVTSGGIAISQAGPASRPRRAERRARVACPPAARVPAAWPPETTGGVLGEFTAQYLPTRACQGQGATVCKTLCNPGPSRTPLGPAGGLQPGHQPGLDTGLEPGSASGRQPRMARSDSRSDPIVASTADGSYPQCAMQF